MIRSASQETTIAVYETGIEEYISGTPDQVGLEFQPFLNNFADLVGRGAKVLEIGSATGRDANYMNKRGIDVLRTDVAKAFVKYMTERGNDAVLFDLLHDTLGRTFDGVLAQAVFLHFTEDEFRIALENVSNHLKLGGYFAVSVKSGEGEEYSTHKFNKPRFFKYWNQTSLTALLAEYNFAVLQTFTPEEKWIQIISQKKAL